VYSIIVYNFYIEKGSYHPDAPSEQKLAVSPAAKALRRDAKNSALFSEKFVSAWSQNFNALYVFMTCRVITLLYHAGH
jgi:hypothetical protein